MDDAWMKYWMNGWWRWIMDNQEMNEWNIDWMMTWTE